MTTNPSIPIPEAAIDAAVQRQALNDGLWARELTERQLTNRRQDAEKVLRAAAPHLVGELVALVQEAEERLMHRLPATVCWSCRAQKVVRNLEGLL